MKPDFLLRRASDDPQDHHSFVVILRLDDGYELAAGYIREVTAARSQSYWAWSGSGVNGRAETRQSAMTAFREVWSASDEDIATMRKEEEWTANKYALWDAGYRDFSSDIRCPCGARFDPGDHEATMAHIGHIKGQMRRSP
jgi:hypothetical protein